LSGERCVSLESQGKLRMICSRRWLSAGVLSSTLVVLLSCSVEAFVQESLRSLRYHAAHPRASLGVRASLRCGTAARGLARNRLHMYAGIQPAFLLDFDGTLCDSVADTTQAAFTAATMLWPDDMNAVEMIDPRDAGVRKSWVGGDWSEYSDDRRLSSEIPRWLEEKMRQLRPVVSRGSDAVLAARLIVTDATNAKTSTLGERPLAVGEIVENWDVLRESMLFRVKFQPAELEESFSDQRPDRHMLFDDWAKQNPIFPGIAAAIAGSNAHFYVITRRDVGFTLKVLESSGISVPVDNIFFAEQGRTKSDILVELVSKISAAEDDETPLVYIDDNANVVRDLVGDLRLADKVRVYFAEWGYSSPSQKAMAARFPRVTTVNLEQFRSLVT